MDSQNEIDVERPACSPSPASTGSAKLTERDRQALAALRTAKHAYWTGYMGRFNRQAHWLIPGYGRATKQMDKLLKLGLAKIIDKDHYSKTAVASSPNAELTGERKAHKNERP